MRAWLFVMFLPLSIFCSTKISKITPLKIKKTLPTQEEFDLVYKALGCVRQELTKQGLQEQIACDLNNGLSKPTHGQTMAGFFLEVESDEKKGDIIPSHLWTPFGAISLVQEYGPEHFEHLSKVASCLKERFKVKTYKDYQHFGLHKVYAITTIDLHKVPDAVELRGAKISSNQLLDRWNTFYVPKEKARLALIQQQTQERQQKKLEEEQKDAEWVVLTKPCDKKGFFQFYGLRLGKLF